MAKCRVMKVIENPFGHDNGALFCDLDSGHAEEWHHDKFQRVKWMVDSDEEPSLVPAWPPPPADELSEEIKDDNTRVVVHAEEKFAAAGIPDKLAAAGKDSGSRGLAR